MRKLFLSKFYSAIISFGIATIPIIFVDTVLESSQLYAQMLNASQKQILEAHEKLLKQIASDPIVVNAVKEHNLSQAPSYKALTEEKWKSLTETDPLVISLTQNRVGGFLRSKAIPVMLEAFVSGSDGTKVGFLSKTTSWSHKGKQKFDIPMGGRSWIGKIEIDKSSGQQQIQIAVPVLDEGKSIGVLVAGFKVPKQ